MAQANRISFADGKISQDPNYQSSYANAAAKFAALNAPAAASSPKQVTTGQQQKGSVANGMVAQAT